MKPEQIWKFLNEKFGYDIPFPKVGIISFSKKEWLKIMNASTRICCHNELEKRALQNNPECLKGTDAGIIYREDYRKRKLKFPLKTNADYVIIMYEGFLDEYRKFIIESHGLSLKEYYIWHVLHEFIHILERKTEKQLLTIEGQDQKLFFEYLDEYPEEMGF